MTPTDARSFTGFEEELQRVSGDDHGEVFRRFRLCDGGVSGLHVAFDPQGEPMYAQWLIHAFNQAPLHHVTHGQFPRLADDETLVEGAYTFVAFRRLGIMGEGMRQLLVTASERGAVRCYTYVSSDNTPSLRGCANVGFELDHIRASTSRLARQRNTRRAPNAAERAQWLTITKPKAASGAA